MLRHRTGIKNPVITHIGASEGEEKKTSQTVPRGSFLGVNLTSLVIVAERVIRGEITTGDVGKNSVHKNMADLIC